MARSRTTWRRFALASQITQAEAKKFFIESTRLRKWATSGILWWNVIDGWPQFSDAIVDYYFGKKLAYHYIRRVQQPVCVIIGEAGPGKYLPVVVCNDTQAASDGQLQGVGCRRWTVYRSKVTVVVPANQNWQVGRIRTYASDQRLYLIEWQVNGQTSLAITTWPGCRPFLWPNIAAGCHRSPRCPQPLTLHGRAIDRIR